MKNGASYTITIKDVISNIAVDVEAVEYQIAANTLDTVPSALSSKFSTIDELKNALRAKVNSAVTASNIAYLDIVLPVQERHKLGNCYQSVRLPGGRHGRSGSVQHAGGTEHAGQQL